MWTLCDTARRLAASGQRTPGRDTAPRYCCYSAHRQHTQQHRARVRGEDEVVTPWRSTGTPPPHQDVSLLPVSRLHGCMICQKARVAGAVKPAEAQVLPRFSVCRQMPQRNSLEIPRNSQDLMCRPNLRPTRPASQKICWEESGWLDDIT